MKCWSSIQLVAESWATNKLKEGKRQDEEQELKHQATCGAILLEQRREILAYQQWKSFKTLPEPQSLPEVTFKPEATQTQAQENK